MKTDAAIDAIKQTRARLNEPFRNDTKAMIKYYQSLEKNYPERLTAKQDGSLPSVASRSAFSLVEVVLAIGVLSLAIVALLGLFGPTVSSVKQVVDASHAKNAAYRVNAEIQRGMTWDEALTATTGEHIFYVWERQASPGDPVELAMSEGSTNGSDFDADLDGDGNTGGANDSSLDNDLNDGSLVGTPLIVTFEEGMQGGPNPYTGFPAATDEGYFPIEINIYPLEPGLIAGGSAPYVNINQVKDNLDPVLTYTAAKTRSF